MPNYERYLKRQYDVYIEVQTFYVLEALREAVKRSDLFKRANAALLDDIESLQRRHTHGFAAALFDYLALACAGEARHASRLALKMIIPGVGGTYNAGRESVMAGSIEYSPTDFLPKLVQVFGSRWRKSAYGGEKWKLIADLASHYGEWPGETFIDTVINLAHNGGPCFNKCVIWRWNDRAIYDFKHFLDQKLLGGIESWENIAVPRKVVDLMLRASQMGHIDISNYHDEWIKGSALYFEAGTPSQKKRYGYNAEVWSKGSTIVDTPYAPIEWGDKECGDVVNNERLMASSSSYSDDDDNDDMIDGQCHCSECWCNVCDCPLGDCECECQWCGAPIPNGMECDECYGVCPDCGSLMECDGWPASPTCSGGCDKVNDDGDSEDKDDDDKSSTVHYNDQHNDIKEKSIESEDMEGSEGSVKGSVKGYSVQDTASDSDSYIDCKACSLSHR